MTTLQLDTSADSIVAAGIVKLADLDYTVSTGSSELTLKTDDKEIKGGDVVPFLLEAAPQLKDTTKDMKLAPLNKHLNLKVYINDGLKPTVTDLKHFAAFRDEISKKKAPALNECVNVTRWFNHLQPLVAPHFSPISIKLNYTPPKKPEKKEAKTKTKGRQGERRAPEAKVTGIGRLGFKVGKIVEIKVHEDAPSLYVSKIDLGEETPRTIVSKLAEKIPIEEMKGRLVVVGSNLVAAELQGVVSQGLVFCASIGEDVEVLSPPEGSEVGEFVKIKDTPQEPGENITRKVFSRAVKGLATDDNCVATYKGAPMFTSKGNVTVKSLKKADIK